MRALTPARIWRAVRWRRRNVWMLWRPKRRSRGLSLDESLRASGLPAIRGSGKVAVGDHCEFWRGVATEAE